jgi:hypothetical protein
MRLFWSEASARSRAAAGKKALSAGFRGDCQGHRSKGKPMDGAELERREAWERQPVMGIANTGG